MKTCKLKEADIYLQAASANPLLHEISQDQEEQSQKESLRNLIKVAQIELHKMLVNPSAPIHKKAWFWGTLGGVAASIVVIGVVVGTRAWERVPTGLDVYNPQ